MSKTDRYSRNSDPARSFFEKKRRTINMSTARYKYQVPESVLSKQKKSISPTLKTFENLFPEDISEFTKQAGASLAIVNRVPDV